MRYDTRQYFNEGESDSVKGFTIIETNEESPEYRIIEKWLASDDERSEDNWVDYWISEEDLLTRVEGDCCQPVKKLSEEQLEEVCELADISLDHSQKVLA